MDRYKYIGYKARQIREENNITRDNLVKMIDEKYGENAISISTLSRIESGRNCSVESYEKVLDILDIRTEFPVMFEDGNGDVYPIQTLSDFILYLPLFKFSTLADILWRLNGNIYTNPDYFYKEVNILYRGIPDSNAKKFADFIKENHSKSNRDTDNENWIFYKDYEEKLISMQEFIYSIDRMIRAHSEKI